ncbi:MAG: hypothetical protein JW894_15695, partial [Bacteroidales bacterium]|nr:hypothetical protein [Bacteroidales bacterium]
MGAKLSEIKFTLSCFWLTGVLLKTIILLSILTAKTSPAIAQDLNIDCHEYLNSLQKPPSDYYEVNNKAVKYVRILYLVPADSSVKPEYALSLKNAVVHLQQWYKEQLYGKKTFNLLPDPIIEIYQTQHNAEWYSTNSNGSYWMWFWNNVTDDAFKLTGGRFWDPNNIWVIYIDAFNACGQCGGCGGLGTAVISANDLRGLTGQPWMPICPGEGREYTPCRYAGGLGHELGHAFGLPHPPGCEEGLPGCDRNSIMWFGYITYPNTYFSENEKATLINSPFINKIKLRECYYDCADLLHNYFYKEEIDLDICEGESYFAERQWQTKTGTYYDTLQTIYGCDSIIITHLTVHDTYESTANAEICGGESYFADEEWQAEAGTYYDSLMTVYGCDSVIITNLSVHEKIE